MKQKPSAPRRRSGRFQFLSHKADIISLHEQGMSGIMIWEKLRDEGRLAISYTQFTCYLREVMRPAPTNDREPTPFRDLMAK